jgi:integrase
MRGSYLVRRGETFHLRMRVPAPLVGAIGSSEIKLSLYEARRRDARLKASYLAFHIRGFFAYLHGAMQNLSRAEVTRLVESWRTKMIARDSDVRRLVETELSSYSLMGYADVCDTTGDVLADLADKILPASYLDRDRQPLRGPRLEVAHEQALAFATAPVEEDNPECDWQPVISRDRLGTINEVSKRDLVNAWLPEAARLYYAKAAACADIGNSLSDSLEPEVQTAPLAVVKPPAVRPVAQEVVPPTELTLGVAWQRYVSHQGERKPAWRDSIPDSARLAWDDFSALIGEKTPLSAIDRAACKRYEAFANSRPRRALTAYRGLSPQQLEHHEVPPSDRLSKTGINELLGRITTFFKWCLQEHLIDRNPAEGLQAFLLEDGEDEDAGVQAWSMEELQALMSPKNLKDFMDSHRHARGASSSQRWTYFPWLLVLGVYTGARLDEIGGLTIEDVVEKHPESEGKTPVFLVRPNEHRGLKTTQARRAIPIHPDLERLGLWEVLRHRKEDVGADLLMWPPRRGDRVAGKATDDFKEYTESLGLYQPRVKVFHSFRHTFKTRARGVLESGALNSIVGHRATDSTGGVYEHALETPRHKHLEQLSQLTFGLDLTGLAQLLNECRSVSPTTAAFIRAARA